MENTKQSNISNNTNTQQPKSASKKMKLPIIRKLHVNPVYLALGIIATILAVFFIRVGLWEQNYLSAMEGSTRATANTTSSIEINESSDDFDATEPTKEEIKEYIVAPDKPRYFSIPYLGIFNARIVEIGLKAQGEMATPYNIYDTGWYVNSALPGQPGATIINAHGGSLGYGIFRNLPKLPVGQEITIEMGDGRILRYAVVESVTKELGEDANNYMNVAFTPIDPSGNTLTLITCTGDWWESSQTYSQRLFVRATLQ